MARDHSREARKRRGRRPRLEPLEGRALMAASPVAYPTASRAAALIPAADVRRFVSVLYPTGTPQPTAAEVRRETFVFKASGRYTLGPGRFDTQSLTIHGYGKPATSNVSLKSHFQYLIALPSDPSRPIDGALTLLPGNTLQSGGSIVLDLLGATGTEVDGLPTRLSWVHDISSGGVLTGSGTTLPGSDNFPSGYVDASGRPVSPAPGSSAANPASSVNNWNLGYGDITFKYIPDARPQAGTLGSGRVIVVARGLLNTSGAQNPIDPNYN